MKRQGQGVPCWCEEKLRPYLPSRGGIRRNSEGQVRGGKYCLFEELHEGEFAYSYIAFDRAGIKYFIKEYVDPIKIDGRYFGEYFDYLNDVKARLESCRDASAQIVDVFVDGPKIYLVQQWMDGKDMSKFLEEPGDAGALTLEERWIFSTIFVSALSRVHEVGMVHVDLKPHQVFFEKSKTTYGWRAYISDFDQCILKEEKDRTVIKGRPRDIVGTVLYKSPEHIKGNVPDFGSDVFTAGIILYQMLLGKYPFKGQTVEDAMRHGSVHFVPRNKCRWVSSDISSLIMRCFSWEISARPSAAELAKKFQFEVNHRIKPWSLKPGEDIDLLRAKETTDKPAARRSARQAEKREDTPSFRPLRLRDSKTGRIKTLYRSQKVARSELLIFGEVALREASDPCFEVRWEGASWKIRGFAPPSDRKPVETWSSGVWKDATDIWIEIVPGQPVRIGGIQFIVDL